MKHSPRSRDGLNSFLACSRTKNKNLKPKIAIIPTKASSPTKYKGGLQVVTGGYKGLQGVTMGYNGLPWVTVGYKGLQVVTRGYRGLQGVTGGY